MLGTAIILGSLLAASKLSNKTPRKSTAGKINFDLIKQFEGKRLNAYLDSVGIPTIGYGNTFYLDGSKVKMGDKITESEAEKLFYPVALKFYNDVMKLVKKPLNKNQKLALTSLAYNIGMGNFRSSTLLKKVNINPKDKTIRNEFMKWDKAGGKKIEGLTKRRKIEAEYLEPFDFEIFTFEMLKPIRQYKLYYTN